MMTLDLLLLLLALVYTLLMSAAIRGFEQVLRDRPPPPGEWPDLTVVVAARDEEAQIGRCVASIQASDYPGRMEVIVVDDGSTDRTAAIVRERALAGGRIPVRLVSPPSDTPGKLHAVRAGVEAASSNFILSTDADCEVGSGWARQMAAVLAAGADYVAGPVAFREGAGAWRGVQSIEFFGLIAVGAGAIGLHHPILSNGANAGFRREAYRSAAEATTASQNGHPAATGDDDLTMQHIAYADGGRVRFCAHPEALVVTEPPPGLDAFVQQRLRWGATAPRYAHGVIRPVLIVIYLFYVALLAAPVLMLGQVLSPEVFLTAVFLKTAPEFVLLRRALRHFGRTRWLRWFLHGQLLHVPYVVGFPAAGLLFGYQWKGRPARVPQ